MIMYILFEIRLVRNYNVDAMLNHFSNGTYNEDK